MSSEPIVLAKIGAAHGLRGEVRVKPFTAKATGLGDYGELHDGSGRSFRVERTKSAKGGLIVKFVGVNDRTAAEALNGVELLIDRSALPEPDEADEFYHVDLIGLLACSENGSAVGRVVAVHDFGAGDILEVKPEAGASILIPFTVDAVPVVSLSDCTLTLADLSEIEVRPEQASGDNMMPDKDTS